MKKERAYQLIVESFDSVKKMDKSVEGAIINDKSILLGPGSPLDSIGFISFLTDLEERLIKETNKDLYLVLSEITAFNINKPELSVEALTNYMVKLSGEN